MTIKLFYGRVVVFEGGQQVLNFCPIFDCPAPDCVGLLKLLFVDSRMGK